MTGVFLISFDAPQFSYHDGFLAFPYTHIKDVEGIRSLHSVYKHIDLVQLDMVL